MAIAITQVATKAKRKCEACGKLAGAVDVTINSYTCFTLCKKCGAALAESLQSTEIPYSGTWFKAWEETKKSILAAMHKNLAADLAAGYEYTGQSIQKQLAAIDEYKHEFDEQLMSFVGKSNKEVEDWCYYDLKSRGWIE